MRYTLAVVALFAVATTLSAQNTIQLRVHESLELQINGSTAAYAIDESIATANGRDGLVTVFGRNSGSTRVMVIAFGRTVASILPGELALLLRAALGLWRTCPSGALPFLSILIRHRVLLPWIGGPDGLPFRRAGSACPVAFPAGAPRAPGRSGWPQSHGAHRVGIPYESAS